MKGAPPRCCSCERRLPHRRARISLPNGLWRCPACQYHLEQALLVRGAPTKLRVVRS